MMIAGAMPPAAHMVTRPRLQIAPLQLVEHGADQDRAGGADRMAERDRAAIDVDLVAVELEVADEFLRDDREGLVDLEQVDVVEREPGLGQHLARRRHRRVEHQRRASRPCSPSRRRARAASGRAPWRRPATPAGSRRQPSTTPDELPAWWTCSIVEVGIFLQDQLR